MSPAGDSILRMEAPISCMREAATGPGTFGASVTTENPFRNAVTE
jgi:hypothetical protein